MTFPLPPSPPTSPTSESDTFSFVDPPSPFPAHLVFSDPFDSPNASCSAIALGPGKGIKKIWDVIAHTNKSKRRSSNNNNVCSNSEPDEFDDSVQPMDWEEFVDDEACYLNSRARSRSPPHLRVFDVIMALPTELSLHTLSFLSFNDLMECKLVSKKWYVLCDDKIFWRNLFQQECQIRGWKVKPNYLAMFDKPDDIPWQSLYRNRLILEERFMTTSFQPARRVFRGHIDSVYCVEHLPSTYSSSRSRIPQILLTGSRDKTIQVWDISPANLASKNDTPTIQPMFGLRGHGGSVLCLQFDETGLMVSGSSDCCAFVWDLGWNPEPLHDDQSLSPSSSTASLPLTTGLGEDAIADGMRPPRLLAILKNHSAGVLDIRMNSKWIVTCSKDATIVVYRRSTLTQHLKLQGHDGPVNSIGLRGDRVVSASGDTRMILWDISDNNLRADKRRLLTFEGHGKGLACVEFSENVIISGSNDYTIKMWCPTTGKCLRTFEGHSSLVRALAYDPISGILVSGSYDRSVRVWNLKKALSSLLPTSDNVDESLAQSQFSNNSGSGSGGGGGSGGLIRTFSHFHKSNVFGVAFDCNRIFSASHDQRIIMLDFGQGLDVDMFY